MTLRHGRTLLAVFACCLAGGIGAAGQAVSSPGAFLHVDVQSAPEPESGIELVLTNTGERPISAYQIRLEPQTSQGKASDFFEDLVPSFLAVGRTAPLGRYEHVGPLLPGQQRIYPYVPGTQAGQTQPGIIPAVLAVTFTDNTAAGQEDLIQGIFENRQGIKDGLTEALRYMRTLRVSPQALENLRLRLLGSSQSGVVSGARERGKLMGLRMAAWRIGDAITSSGADPDRLKSRFVQCIEAAAEQAQVYARYSARAEERK